MTSRFEFSKARNGLFLKEFIKTDNINHIKKVAIAIVILIIILLGFFVYFNKNRGGFNLIKPQPQTGLAREDVFSKLTKNSWCNRSATKGSMFPDYTDYKFKPDGTYELHQFSDYPIPVVSGKWNFEQDSMGEWFLLYDNGQRLRFALNKNGSLTLENSALDSCDPITANRDYTAENLPPIQLSGSVNSIIDKLTATRWKRANDFDLDYEPTLVEFKKGFTYTTTYRNSECQNSGSWDATAKEISGKSLTDKCDPRNDTYPESLNAKLLDNGFLFLDYDLYVPENYALSKGIIWSVFGYSDVVNIKVEYNMPIIAGVPNKLDVEMTNVGKERYPGSTILQRFSITEGYERNYRQANNTISRVSEIAGQDLGSKTLQPGDTYKFSLDITFNKSGKQTMYINALMFGSTQSWDTHQVYSINVQ